MSSAIWTACAAGTEVVRPLTVRPWRVVEAQHVIATRRLVDSDAEQDLLEQLLEVTKPPPRDDAAHLHFLLATPFRYPPLPHGSRFGTVRERGLWYGATARETALAEVAFYRLRFLDDTTAELPALHVQLTLFRARVAARRAVDLTAPPFDAWHDVIAHPSEYGPTQALGATLRAEGVLAAQAPSARQPGGINVVVLHPSGFAAVQPDSEETWTATVHRHGVEVRRTVLTLPDRAYAFARTAFLVDGELPRPR